ncbi:YtpI family protein [Paenibacillus jilunlii]|uniref:YtpI-like protein n=1 Tax=Paenibacillus jilunlii TaxID=682956 RepID=A0A1G9FQ15_9BACL|nr:YtpI family protein [Paenibacillus jilunlii]KWX71185.1 hypothetical protein AML91_23325 [Paenibacillus jilunlii]SDK90494.1 YtpI-like protein [Paenibacillus jilunlii]
MILFIKYVLFILVMVCLIGAAVYSYTSRRAQNPLEKGAKRSIMNILLGAMLVSLSLICMFVFRGSTVNVIIEAVFLLIGAFNIFSGLRSYGFYSRNRKNETPLH